MRTLLLLSLFALSTPALPTIQEVLQKVDQNQRMGTDIKAQVLLTQNRTGQGTKVMNMMYYRRDSDESFLILMTAPQAEKGNGYLRVGDNFWMYRKNTRTFQHVNRDESIGGSDASAEDFETRKLTELYQGERDSSGAEKISETMLGKIPVYHVVVSAKVNDVSYPRKEYWVRKDSFLPLKEQAFAGSGTLMLTSYYLNYTQIEGRYIPVKQLFVDEFEKGNKTVVELSGIDLKQIDNAVFTKAYLENLSQ